MKREIADKWVAALRSGEYKQTRDTLAMSHASFSKHCCLGVLCELAIKEGVELKTTAIEFEFPPCTMPEGTTYTTFDGEAGKLPDQVASWADMTTSSGRIARRQIETGSLRDRLPECDDFNDAYVSLATLNDCGVGFSGIADVIEEYWEEL